MADCIFNFGGGGGGSSWVENIPEMHRNIFRGKSLGSSVTAAQLAAIEDGSFDDLYVGDYWTIPITINNVEITVNWRIADINYYLLRYPQEGRVLGTASNHLVILPDDGLYETLYNTTQSSAGYYGSLLRSSRVSAKTAIDTAFPNMVLTYSEYLTTSINGTTCNVTKADCDVEAMNPYMLYGHALWFLHWDNANSPTNRFTTKMGVKQFALFSIAPQYIESEHAYWLQDQSQSYVSANVYNAALLSQPITPNTYNRPFFLLGDAS